MRILVAIDGSAHSLRALRAAIRLLKRVSDAERHLTLLSVHDPRSLQLAAGLVGSKGIKQYLAQASDEDLAQAKGLAERSGLTYDTLSRTGPIADTIGKTATEGKYDILVVGAKGRGNLKDLLLGSVAHRITSLTKVPVLMIR